MVMIDHYFHHLQSIPSGLLQMQLAINENIQKSVEPWSVHAVQRQNLIILVKL